MPVWDTTKYFFEGGVYVVFGLGVCLELLFGARLSKLIRDVMLAEKEDVALVREIKHLLKKGKGKLRNVNSVDKYVDKYVNRQKFWGVFLYTWEKRCVQARILGASFLVITGFLGVFLKCGKDELLQKGAVGMFLCTVWISVVFLAGNSGKKSMLKEGLLEYIMNFEEEEASATKIQEERSVEVPAIKEKSKVKRKRELVVKNPKREEMERVKQELVEELKQERKKREDALVQAKKRGNDKPRRGESEYKEEVVEKEEKTDKDDAVLRELLLEFLGEK